MPRASRASSWLIALESVGMRTLRVIVGTLLIALCLDAASRAVKDCAVAPYVSENCLWLWVRAHTGLPQSKLLRALVLEGAGLAMLAGIVVSFRYVFPGRRA